MSVLSYLCAATAEARRHRWFLPVLSGLLLVLAFPCHPDHPLAFLFHGAWAGVALLPLLASLPGAGFKEGFRRGWVCGAVFNLGCLYWIGYTQGGGVAVVGGAVLAAVYLGLFTGLFAGCLGLALDRWGLAGLAAAPFLWTAQEYLLSLGELGFPWLLLGHSQAVFPALIQHAAFTGVYGVSFWVVLIDVLAFLLLLAPLSRRGRMAAAGGLALGLLLPYLYGRAVIPPDPDRAGGLRVGLIQPNLGMEKWGLEGLDLSFTALATLSRQAASQRADLLVWPETALPCYVQRRSDCRERVDRLVAELGIPLLTGAPDYDQAARTPYNSAFLFQPGQPQVQSYAKTHLVPFGERTPFRDRIPLLRDIDWTALTGDLGPAEFAPGPGPTLFTLSQGAFAVLICFESAFPDLARRSVRTGAQFLVVITNDSWFGASAGPYQHAQLAILRAVENRRAVARCATTGISAFIDPFGRTFQATSLSIPAAQVRSLPLEARQTFYTRHGDLFAQFNLLASAAILALLAWPRLRRRAA